MEVGFFWQRSQAVGHQTCFFLMLTVSLRTVKPEVGFYWFFYGNLYGCKSYYTCCLKNTTTRKPSSSELKSKKPILGWA